MKKCRNCRQAVAPGTGHRMVKAAPLDPLGLPAGAGTCSVHGVAVDVVGGLTCPECGGGLSAAIVGAQLPLLRHGGHGGVAESRRRWCAGCGWQGPTDTATTNPRRAT